MTVCTKVNANNDGVCIYVYRTFNDKINIEYSIYVK